MVNAGNILRINDARWLPTSLFAISRVFGHASPLTGGGDGEADIAFGHLSDRIGREWVWMIGNLGFVICYFALIGLRSAPTPILLYAMIVAQGTLGYSFTLVMGPIPAEIFEGRYHGSIFGTVMLAAILGGAAGPWITGILYDATATYSIAFCIAAACNMISILAIWLAAPRKVRAVAGRAGKLIARSPR